MKDVLGIILTILIFVMSIFFFVTALLTSAAHRDWKSEAELLSAELTTLKSHLADVKKTTDEKQRAIHAEKVARAQQLSQLESLNVTLRGDLTRVSEQLQEENVLSQERLTRLEQAEKRVSELDKQNKVLADANVELTSEVAQSYEKLTDLTNKLFELGTETQALEDLNGRLSKALSEKSLLIKSLGIDEDALTKDVTPPISAVVAKVQGNKFVILAGGDDGLKAGHTLDIYRGGDYIGKGRVQRVENDLAVLQTIREFSTGKAVLEGDNVTSKF